MEERCGKCKERKADLAESWQHPIWSLSPKKAPAHAHGPPKWKPAIWLITNHRIPDRRIDRVVLHPGNEPICQHHDSDHPQQATGEANYKPANLAVHIANLNRHSQTLCFVH